MSSIKPIYLIALLAVILLVAFLKLNNPYREYGTKQYWEQATVESIKEIPDEALKLGNKNGPVLSWAALTTSDPEIIHQLVARGAYINESDTLFAGTPLTNAAAHSAHPEIIATLVKLGAEVNIQVNNGITPLMLAAAHNHNMGIVEILVDLGANLNSKNDYGETALDIASQENNIVAIKALSKFLK